MLDDPVVLPSGREEGGERQHHHHRIDQEQIAKHARSWRSGRSLPSAAPGRENTGVKRAARVDSPAMSPSDAARIGTVRTRRHIAKAAALVWLALLDRTLRPGDARAQTAGEGPTDAPSDRCQ